MNILQHHKWFILIVTVVFSELIAFAWAGPFPSNFTNIGSVVNTRHNMTQQPIGGVVMNGSRNDYREVCVYCHTPHGGNTLPQMPLWNRTVKATTYTVYNSSSLTQTVSQPGNNSLTCLSCHDGQTAMDSIVNMPGTGMYQASQTTSQNAAFLDTWTNIGIDTTMHRGFNSVDSVSGGYLSGNGTGSDGIGCMVCHSPEGSGISFAQGNDMRLMNIGTDLSNDHPVGITFPATTGAGTGWNTPGGVKGTRCIWMSSRTPKGIEEIRTYSGQVECASCHDPHGMPDPANGNIFKPTFMRVANGGATGSALCLTCHDR